VIHLKNASVNLSGTHRMLWFAIFTAAEIWERHGVDLVLTSVKDGDHPGGARPSFHPLGLAFDARTHDLEAPMIACEELRAALGPDFDVMFEGEGTGNAHVHVQHDPPVPRMSGRALRGP